MNKNIIAIDIETVPRPGIMDTWYPQWAAGKYPGKEGEDLEAMAALYPEFGQICCVCWGEVDDLCLRKPGTVYGFVAQDEAAENQALVSLAEMLKDPSVTLIGHNIKGFDIPFIIKRYLYHGLEVPQGLRLLGKKPWEIPHLDTMELMRFGSSNMSLRSAAMLLGEKDPKGSCDGVKVWDLWRQDRMSEIRDYCSGDVRAVAAIYYALHRFAGLD